ncbi:hypothetical protein CTAYLR_003210 [Chrysophaeum taylorii]|uniref:Uncharacterized protein n=1 Tax=Chrysophaeum taylorii TaxID=2483200 RepID=A0AAD7UD17_9STRA|nr:hypothetical protein CTAYLR_003210 [Chrysophaeum taylorii]
MLVLLLPATANCLQHHHHHHHVVSKAIASTALALSLPAHSLGPSNIDLYDIQYQDTGKTIGEICAGRPLKAPGEKVAAGLLPKCVLVTAKSTNPTKKKAIDAGVFGYVKTATGDSAIANNPDFRSDAGQFAMIPTVPPGDAEVSFEFVAVIPDSVKDLGDLVFENVKAITYPGGARMATFTECELDSLSDACDEEQQKFISK